MKHVVRRPRTDWTPEQEERLWDMFQGGAHPSEVASTFGVTQAAATSRYQKLKRKKEQSNANHKA